MTSRYAILLLLAALAALAATPASAAPLRVLVVTGGHDFAPSFWELFSGDDGIVVEKAEHPRALAELAPDRAGRFDVIVLYDMCSSETIGEEGRRDFLALLDAGKGLVVLHHALASHPEWPEYRRVVGGRYILREETRTDGTTVPASTYRHDVDFRVEIADPAHPIVHGLDDFDLHDEVYGATEVDPGVHQLLRTSHPESGAVIGWCREVASSRIVVLQPGHGPEAWRHPSYRLLLARSIRWAARRLDDAAGHEGGGTVPRPWRRLFNGRDLDGWRATGDAVWEVRDGVLIGGQGPGAAGGDLIGEEEFEDFELAVTFRARWPANSGVWFRYRSPEETYQADILEWREPRCWSGTIYRPGKVFVALNEDETTVRRDGWNTLRVRARGESLAVDLNGVRVAEARDELSRSGSFGFQVHAGREYDGMRIEILEARIRPLAGVSDDVLLLEEAPARIERHRRGPLTIRVVDDAGHPVSGARVTLRQRRHEFLFGCNIFMHGRFNGPADEETYRTRFADLFNFATLPFYWGAYEPVRSEPEHDSREAVARWCRERGIETKGHPLVWNHPSSVPPWLPAESAAIRELSEARTRDCVARFRGLIDRWDVVNEAVDPWRFGEGNRMTAAMQELGVVDWTVRSFLAAREANPGAFLLINDYRADAEYEKLIETLVHEGKPVYDAIGIQSHMHDGAWSPSRTWEACDRLARFGAPLHFTETTIVSGPRSAGRRWEPSTPEGEAVQAREAARFYTVLFSHPAAEAITWWDFADRGAWQGAPAGFLRRDLTPKPVYERVRDLVRGRWWTDVTIVTDERGEARARATFGDHEIEARRGAAAGAIRHEHRRSAGRTSVEVRLGRPVASDVRLRDRIGVNIHFTGAPERDLALLDEGGFGWIRMEAATRRGIPHGRPR
jgi:GH35 family endo-1,4-beta-xylanase/type 1 glutamine amidotransferase